MSELFSIQLQNRQQQGRDGIWLDLPTTTEQVQAALRQIGISSDNPQGLFISGYFAEEEKRFAIPYNMVLASNVDELNFLASRLETLSTGERAELNAALQAPQSELFSIGRITDFPENVDYYVHLPDVHGPAQLGDYYLNRSGMVDMPEEWKGGIDTAQFGRYVAQQEQGAFTQYGYLVKSGDEWQKVHEGQPVPEEYRVLSFPAPEVLRDAANIPPPVQPETEPQKVIPIILNGKDSAERMKEITDRLETGIQELFDSDHYKAYLTTMAKFHNYSFNNTLLIAMQGGQLVAGFNKWKDTFHRTVKKGEKGIKILAPAPYKVKQKMEKRDEQGKPILDKDGKPLTEEKTVQIPAFKVVSVFDVSQTEGEPLPSIAVDELSGSVQDYQDFFKALEQASPVPIGFEDIEGGAHGYFHLLDNRIAIQEGMSQLQTIKTAIHEIAHAKLHTIDPNTPEQSNRPDSRTREVQAESVAYAVCQHYGLDTSEYSFGYVAGWSSGRELAELKASLEFIRSTAHELISALDEHLAELRQQREADLSAAQETAFVLDSGNTLFIQTCDSGYDYTLYGPDNKALDGGQLDAPGLTLPDAGQEALNLLGQTAAVSEVLLGDKLAAFQEAAEKANEIPAPVKIPDPAAEPTVTILWSESDKLQDGEIMPLSMANRVFEELDTAQHTDREKDGYTGGWYDKTAFRIDFTMNGQPDNYEGRQDFGDGEGSLVQHIQNYHEYYTKDENWKNFVLHNKGPEAWEQDKAEREMVLTEFIPYLKQHCNLSAMERAATTALREEQNISPEQAAYYNTVVAYVQDCRPLLNQGQYNLPEPPKLADFDQSLQDYKAQVQAEIAQEAATAGMTVEEYAAAGFEAPQQDSFSIYQLRNKDSTRDYRFEPYDRLQAAGRTVDKSNYTEVYTAPLAAGTTLEDIYRTFNVDHPADFKGHSLSVSDVVVLHQNGHDTAHYCDSVGFQQVPEFLQENPLRTAELSTEQNENMIDGVLNNAPSLGELEAKAKAGEQISLADLAAAVKAEEKAPKAKKSRTAKPKKPSIRVQLDAAKKEQSKQTPPREKTKELEV
ncbi:YodL domain-containing protein [Faecalibacterium sp. 7]|uniref:YodL domain-containing protein n=1 Tax=Faecalibacterium sp. 7 TaxID=3402017 RepID=UPI003C2ABC2A